MRDTGATLSFVALIISFASASFAGIAAWSNRQKLRLDLYNRRFDVYSRALDFYHALLRWEPTELEKETNSLLDSPELRTTQTAFIKAKAEARFLFAEKSGIRKVLEEMHDDTIGIIGFKRDLSPKLAGQTEMMLLAYAKFSEQLNRVNAAIPLLEDRLSDYLDFHVIGRAVRVGRWWA